MPDEALSSGTFAEWTVRKNIDPDRIVGWMIWYADGRRFTSRESRADDLPDTGVQCVRIFHTLAAPDGVEGAVYSLIFNGNDPYWLPGATRPKEGTWVSDAEHDRFTGLVVAARW